MADRTIEFKGETFELKYNLKCIKIIENALQGSSIMGLLAKDSGMLSLNNLEVFFAFGLKKVGSDAFIDPNKGKEIAEVLIESEGYIKLNALVLGVLQEDCPFFFQVD